MSVPKTISFSELVQGRNASVRVTADGLIYVIDLAVVMTGKSRDDASWTIRHLSEEHFSQVTFYMCFSPVGKPIGLFHRLGSQLVFFTYFTNFV